MDNRTQVLYEVRYPFGSAFEFLSGGYVFQVEAWHLVLGYAFLLWGTARVLKTNLYLHEKLSLVFFLSSVYTNYAFLTFGISLSEWFGVAASLALLVRQRIVINIIAVYMCLFAAIAVAHLCIVLGIYEPEITPFGAFSRMIPSFKIIVLAINTTIVIGLFKSGFSSKALYDMIVPFFLGVILAYYLQILVFVSGAVPYGSFSPAGWASSPLPSFGAVAVERGHLGKFFVPLLPLVLYFALTLRVRVVPLLFISICVLNLSASSMAFFGVYLGLSVLLVSMYAPLTFASGMAIISATVLLFSDQIAVLLNKVYELAILGSDVGGRSFALLPAILEKFPMGYGYGGSTYRDAHGMDFVLNNPIVAFWGMFSVFGVPLFMALVLLTGHLLGLSFSRIRSSGLESRMMIIAVAGAWFIFSVDIIWFVPSVWLPIIVLYGMLVGRGVSTEAVRHRLKASTVA